MNCGCIKRLEGEIAKAPFVTAKAGENIKVTCAATGFRLTDDNSMELILSIPFRVRGTGKGFISEKGKEMPVAASFCPFCGKSTKPNAALAAAGAEFVARATSAHEPLVAALQELRLGLRYLGMAEDAEPLKRVSAALTIAGAV